MRPALSTLLAVVAAAPLVAAQSIDVPKTVDAGSAFTIQTSGSGPATLVVVGLGQAIKREVTLGQPISFAAGTLYNAGHYFAILSGTSAEPASFEVIPGKPAKMTLAIR